MYIHPRPSSIEKRDVIGAWLICGLLAASLFLYPEIAGHSGTGAREVAQAVRAASRGAPCSMRPALDREPRA